ncbi:MAG: hypothetical protein LBH17_07695 [Oscillospiraceae bacterium]|jgi:hypothetical protein|nr:hypothetical protein [Oscillospiraceae bacterium]
MNDLKKYMNDPEIAGEPMALREVHAIRFMLQNAQKEMLVGERVKTTRDSVKALEDELGVKFRRPGDAYVRRAI